MLNSIYNSKKNLNSLFFSFLLLFVCSKATTEDFRVHKTFLEPINQDTQKAETKVGINDSLAVELPEDLTFLKGIEITFKLTEELSSWADAIALGIYDNITPLPQENIIDYSGNRKYFTTFPYKISWTIQIPLTEKSDLKDSPYTTAIAYIPDIKNKIIFLRLQLVMKGMPESLLETQIPTTIKPIFSDEGKLKLTFKETDKNLINQETKTIQPFTVFIDNKKITPNENGIIESTGTHTVSIVSDYYRNEVRTVQINQAKTTNLEIPLRDTSPTIIITAPTNATVFFDGNQIKNVNEEFSIPEGAHTVHFVIGDYEIEKKINVSEGHSYKVSCVVDATVTEIE